MMLGGKVSLNQQSTRKSQPLCCNSSVTPDPALFPGGYPENIRLHLYQAGPDLLIWGHQWFMHQNCCIGLSAGSMVGNVPPPFVPGTIPEQGSPSDMPLPPHPHPPPPSTDLLYFFSQANVTAELVPHQTLKLMAKNLKATQITDKFKSWGLVSTVSN